MRNWFALLAFVVIVVSVFSLGISGDFFFDDIPNIIQNVRIRIDHFNLDGFIYAALSFHDGHGERALPMLSFAIDYWRAGGIDPFTFKVTNLFIHVLTSLIMLGFIRQLLLAVHWNAKHAMWGALIIGLAWAIHPMQVSSVLYIVQRMQSMEVMFMLLALWSYLLMRQDQLAGGRGRGHGVLALVAWLLALASKEDAIIFPIFTLIIELIIFRFQATQKAVERGLKQSYTLFVILFILVYFFVIIPRYGCLDTCGRDFTSFERVLTQARVLMMYIGQILWPVPDAFVFTYDTYTISRSLWQPWTTIISILAIISLLVWAFRWRVKRPLFAFGVFFFFVGHFVSSNVIPLELVFEHRNYLPLLGIILAVTDLFLMLRQQYFSNNKYVFFTVPSLVLILFAVSTTVQSYTWGDPIRLVQKMVRLEPDSRRAWMQYTGMYYQLYNRTKQKDYLINAAHVAEQAQQKFPNDVSLAGNRVLFKTMAGLVQDQDWQEYYEALRAPITIKSHWPEKRISLLFLKSNTEKGLIEDTEQVIQAFEIALSEGVWFEPAEYLDIGSFVYHGKDEKRALAFFEKAVETHPQDSEVIQDLYSQLIEVGKPDWVDHLKLI